MEFSFVGLLYGGFGVGLYSALAILLSLRQCLRVDFIWRIRPAQKLRIV